MTQVGLYDPRARELVWILLANRAARGLALAPCAGQSIYPGAGRRVSGGMDRTWVRDFMDRCNAEGMIPVSLTELEMTPDKARAFGPQQP